MSTPWDVEQEVVHRKMLKNEETEPQRSLHLEELESLTNDDEVAVCEVDRRKSCVSRKTIVKIKIRRMSSNRSKLITEPFEGVCNVIRSNRITLIWHSV